MEFVSVLFDLVVIAVAVFAAVRSGGLPRVLVVVGASLLAAQLLITVVATALMNNSSRSITAIAGLFSVGTLLSMGGYVCILAAIIVGRPGVLPGSGARLGSQASFQPGPPYGTAPGGQPQDSTGFAQRRYPPPGNGGQGYDPRRFGQPGGDQGWGQTAGRRP